MSPARVIIADDHVPTRAGVRDALERSGFEVVAEVASGPAAVAAALAHRPDVCLLDVQMPGGDGLEAARRISKDLPDTAVVMLTASSSDEHLLAAVQAGAAGYLLKDTDPDRLGHALRGVLAGEAAVPRTLVVRLLQEVREGGQRRSRLRQRPRGMDLSDRQWQVVELMREGRTTKEIALELGLSAVTVRRHISELLARIGAPDRATAVRMVEEAERRSR